MNGIQNTPIKAWECDTCGVLHDDHADALECCAPEPRPRYICPVCKEVHVDKWDAAECCAKVDRLATPLSAEERRAQGSLL